MQSRPLLWILLVTFAGCSSAPPHGEDQPREADSGSTEEPPVGPPEELGNRTQENESLEHPPEAEAKNGSDSPTRYPPWLPLEEAELRPGARVWIEGHGYCSSNFLFRTPDNATLLLGSAAHCFVGIPLGAEVQLGGAEFPGVLWYSSHLEVGDQCLEEPRPVECSDDFALIAVDARDRPKVHPAVWDIQGPTGLRNLTAEPTGSLVTIYANSTARPDGPVPKQVEGIIAAKSDTPHGARIVPFGPIIFGDSGSGIQADDGTAIGITNTLSIGVGAYSLQTALESASQYRYEVELITWHKQEPGNL